MQKAVPQKSVKKKSADKPSAASPVAGKKHKPATSQASPTAGKKSKPPTFPTALQWKQKTLPRQSKEKLVDCYADEHAAVSKRKKRVGKPGRRDPHEEFGYGGVKKKRAPTENYEEDEEEWEDEDVVVTEDVAVTGDVALLSNETDAEEDNEDDGILFEKHTNLLMPFMKKMNVLIGLAKTSNALLVNVLQGGMFSEAFGENAQGQVLTDPMLKALRDQLAAMSPNPNLAARFHKAFLTQYNKLLLFKQEYDNVRVSPAHDEQLSNWVKNMKTQLRYMLQGDGKFIIDSRYASFLRKVGITFTDDSGF
jgi:hypothetical protein